MRLVFVPPIPLSAFPYKQIFIRVRRITGDELRNMVSRAKEQGVEIKSYIRHKSTVDILNKYLGLNLEPSAELYEYRPGDTIIIVGLKSPQRGKEVEIKSIEELDIAVVEIVSAQ